MLRDRDFFVMNGEARLRVRTLGQGPVVFFLHGWALDLNMWTPQFADLSREYRTLALDRRGFGFSSGEPSIAADVADLRRLFDVFEIRDAALVGMSQGARVALRFAHAYPRDVRCLVLDGPPHIQAIDAQVVLEIPLDEYRERIQREGLETFKRDWLDHPLMRLHTHDPRMHSLLHEIVERYPATDLRATQPDLGHIDFDLRELAMPVLVINGELDSVERLAAGEQIARAVVGGTRVLIPNAGHLPNLDNPAIYNDALRSFARECFTSTTIENRRAE